MKPECGQRQEGRSSKRPGTELNNEIGSSGASFEGNRLYSRSAHETARKDRTSTSTYDSEISSAATNLASRVCHKRCCVKGVQPFHNRAYLSLLLPSFDFGATGYIL